MIGTLQNLMFGKNAVHHKHPNAIRIDKRIERPVRCSQCVHRIHPENCGLCMRRNT